MKFVYASPEEATTEIAEIVNESLEFGSVLLLVSGGSNIRLAIDIRNSLKQSSHITIGLIDERYGPVGHPDSNWQQLLDAGFNTKHIHLMPIITDNEVPIEQASHSYAQRLQNAINSHDTVIGIFGIGTDGHTAGILPNSPALESHEIVTYFNGPDFPRITITPKAIPFFNYAYLVSYQESKLTQLKKLQSEAPVTEQPAQALKQIPNLVVYTNFQEIRS